MKTDLKRDHPGYIAPRGEFAVIDVPPARYLAIDGTGDPNTSRASADAVATLYAVAYRVKFASRRELDHDYVVPPLEALWWADDMGAFTAERDKSRWSWTVLSLVPEWVPDDMIDAARAGAADAPAIGSLHLRHLEEGRCVQILHVGSYDDEAPVLARLHDEYLPANDLVMTGKHHEIYLSDPRRTAPARLRTILRQPVAAR